MLPFNRLFLKIKMNVQVLKFFKMGEKRLLRGGFLMTYNT